MDITKYVIAIGGGEIRNKDTLKIDGFVAGLAEKRAAGARANALFVGTASHDSMPYYNSFHKTYTGVFGLKTDCVLTVYGEMDYEKIKGKFDRADMIYVGGGDTLFMIDSWKKSGVLDLIKKASDRGVIICGLSAGAICWFEQMYTDSDKSGQGKYSLHDGLAVIKGGACPHFDERRSDFYSAMSGKTGTWYAIENNSAIVFINGKPQFSVSSGGNSYEVCFSDKDITESKIPENESVS